MLYFSKLIGLAPKGNVYWLFRIIRPVAVLIFMWPRLAVYEGRQVPRFFIVEQLVFITGSIRHIIFNVTRKI
ncbi:hypothetical protein D3C72_2406570 [compost metagenome]